METYKALLDSVVQHAKGKEAECAALQSAAEALSRKLRAVSAAGDAMNALLTRAYAASKAKEAEVGAAQARAEALEGQLAAALATSEQREALLSSLEAKLVDSASAVRCPLSLLSLRRFAALTDSVRPPL